jgi:hypothetical protein
VIADKCLELVEKEDAKGGVGNPVVLSACAKAAKGMVELVRGNLKLGLSSPWFFFFFLVTVAALVNY